MSAATISNITFNDLKKNYFFIRWSFWLFCGETAFGFCFCFLTIRLVLFTNQETQLRLVWINHTSPETTKICCPCAVVALTDWKCVTHRHSLTNEIHSLLILPFTEFVDNEPVIFGLPTIREFTVTVVPLKRPSDMKTH